MQLLRLEILGFKSFVDKAVIHFDQKGISMIVGPNGCGKSNVVDAIRWALGEQSAKSLRGDHMEDVIFAGSRTRKPLSLAQVSLIFSNTAGDLTSKYKDFKEINVTRRLYRSGESQYLINKSTCRLTDIRELFMDTGISGKGYAIIEQGQIAQIIAGKQTDRRILLDEAAGIVKFKVKKKDAERRLHETKQNLLRVRDLLSELESREESLEKQAKEATLFLELKGQGNKLFREITSFKWHKAKQEQNTLAQAKAKEEAKRNKINLASASLQSRLDAATVKKTNAQLQSEVTREEIEAKQKQLQTKDTQRQLGLQSQANTKSQLEEIRERRSKLEEKNKQLEITKEEGSKQVASLQKEINELKEALGIKQKEFVQIQGEKKQIDTDEENLYKAKLASLQIQTAKQEALTNSEIRKQDILKRKEELAEQKESLQKQMETGKKQLVTLNEEIEEIEEKQELYQQKRQAIQEAQLKLSQSLFANQKLFHEKGQILAKHKARLESLEELASSFSDFEESTSRFLQYMKERSDLAKELSFYGSLAQFVASKQEERSSKLVQYYFDLLLFKDKTKLSHIKKIIEEQNIGRISILFDSNIDRYNPVVPTLLQENFQEYQGRFASDTVYMSNQGIRIDQDDTTVLPSNVIILGDKKESKGDLYFARQQEIEDLKLSIVTLEDEIEEIKEAVATQELQDKEQEKEEAQLRNLQFQVDIDKVSITKTKDELTRTFSRLESEKQTIQKQEEEQTALFIQLEEEKAEIQAFLAEVQEKEVDTQTQEKEYAKQKEEKEKELGESRENLESTRIQLAAKEEQIRNAKQQKIALEQEEKSFLQEWDVLTKSLLEQEEKTKKTRETLQALQDEIPKIALAIQEQEATWREQKEIITTLEDEHNKLIIERGEIIRDIGKQEAILQEQSLKIEQLQETIESQEQELLEATGMQPEEVIRQFSVETYSLAQAEQERKKIITLLQGMDKVNLAAKEEYEELKERLTFLRTQVNDLETSMTSILDSIQTMENESQSRFMSSFNAINENFAQLFSSFFEGGKASLRLLDTDNPLNSDIEILAYMPGKRVQSLNLLSGGEKALTAIALIFAIFQNKPSPFCVLDEVDAPLDEANNEKFNKQILKMTELTQFIIITHNKTTMGIADLLLGVTMQEAGSSKVVSVNLKESLALTQ